MTVRRQNQLLAAIIVVLVVLTVWLLSQRSPDRVVYPEPTLVPMTAPGTEAVICEGCKP